MGRVKRLERRVTDEHISPQTHDRPLPVKNTRRGVNRETVNGLMLCRETRRGDAKSDEISRTWVALEMKRERNNRMN